MKRALEGLTPESDCEHAPKRQDREPAVLPQDNEPAPPLEDKQPAPKLDDKQPGVQHEGDQVKAEAVADKPTIRRKDDERAVQPEESATDDDDDDDDGYGTSDSEDEDTTAERLKAELQWFQQSSYYSKGKSTEGRSPINISVQFRGKVIRGAGSLIESLPLDHSPLWYHIRLAKPLEAPGSPSQVVVKLAISTLGRNPETELVVYDHLEQIQGDMIPRFFGQGKVTVYGETSPCIFLQPCGERRFGNNLTDGHVKQLREIFLELSARKVAKQAVSHLHWVVDGNKITVVDFDSAIICDSVADALRRNVQEFNQWFRMDAPKHAVDGQFRSLIEEEAKREASRKAAREAKKAKRDATKKNVTGKAGMASVETGGAPATVSMVEINAASL